MGRSRCIDLTTADAAKAERASFKSTGSAGDGGRLPARSGDAARRLRRQGRLALGAPSAGGPKNLAGHTAQIYSVVWSPDGKLVATAAADKTVRLWDVAKGAQVRQINAHEKVAYAVAFHPKGDLLATGGDDKLIKYWNVADGKELRKSQGHGAPIYSLSFQPRRDQARLGVGRQDDPDLERRRRQRAATSSTAIPTTSTPWRSVPTARSWPRSGYGGNLYVWDVATAKALFHQHIAPYTMTYGLAWSPDGKQLAVAASDNKAYLLKLP